MAENVGQIVSGAGQAAASVTTAVSTAINPLLAFIGAIGNVIGSVTGFISNTILQSMQIAAGQRVALNAQNNKWNVEVVQSGTKNYAFLAFGAIVAIGLIAILSKSQKK